MSLKPFFFQFSIAADMACRSLGCLALRVSIHLSRSFHLSCHTAIGFFLFLFIIILCDALIGELNCMGAFWRLSRFRKFCPASFFYSSSKNMGFFTHITGAELIVIKFCARFFIKLVLHLCDDFKLFPKQ